MVLKNVFAAIAGVMLLAWSGLSAAEYRADEFLGLDLSRAVLSPKPLGPASEFAPVAVEANADHSGARAAARVEHIRQPKVHVAHLGSAGRHGVARAKVARYHGNPRGPASASASVAVEAKAASVRVAHTGQPKIHVAHLRSERRPAVAPTRIARHHGNPLDAQAFDTRIQVWPCRSGGICNWKR